MWLRAVGKDLQRVEGSSRLFLRLTATMSYKHKGFDNDGFELDVGDYPYNQKGKL